MTLDSTSSRPASLDFRLFSYWANLPSGRAVTMDDMMEAVDASDPQVIRSSLTRLRRGQVPDPSRPGQVPDPSRPGDYLRPLPIRWNPQDRNYYDMSNISRDAVSAMIPGQILSGAFEELLTRVSTLDSSMNQDGLVRAAHLLGDRHIRDLIAQLPLREIWRIHNTVLGIAQARQLLELQEARSRGSLPESTIDSSQEGKGGS